MTLDVYVCECDKEFLVKDGAEPNYCPFCDSMNLDWSHEVEV